MGTTTVVINWDILLPYIISTLAPTIMGFLQQYNKTVSEKAPWYAKVVLTTAIGALMTMLTNYVAATEASVLVGGIAGSIGSINIALRKGAERFKSEGEQPPEIITK